MIQHYTTRILQMNKNQLNYIKSKNYKKIKNGQKNLYCHTKKKGNKENKMNKKGNKEKMKKDEQKQKSNYNNESKIKSSNQQSKYAVLISRM